MPAFQEFLRCANDANHTPVINMGLIDCIQVLRYSQADLQNAVKAAREAEKKAVSTR